MFFSKKPHTPPPPPGPGEGACPGDPPGERPGACSGVRPGLPPGALSLSALRDREVVSVTDGRRLGYLCDVTIDITTGKVCAFTLPGELRFFGFSRKNALIIPWEAVVRIGKDIILVDPCRFAHPGASS